MNTLDTSMLVGVDLWARTRFSIPPLPIRTDSSADTTAATATGFGESEAERLQLFLDEELALFEGVHRPTDLVKYTIRVRIPHPIKQRYRPRNPAMQKIIDDEVAKMENAGIIEPSCRGWSSPIVLVQKKDGRHCFCIDFRRVNEVTERDACRRSTRLSTNYGELDTSLR